MQTIKSCDETAAEVLALLREKALTLVTAESCTAGLLTATLARIPGMSAHLAGSFVVYQVESKVAWLGVPQELIRQHDVVSPEVAACMAQQAIRRTPHAAIAISITGHLGPGAPADLDGVAWLGWAVRDDARRTHRLQLPTTADLSSSSEQRTQLRHLRQENAVLQSLSFLRDRLAEMP